MTSATGAPHASGNPRAYIFNGENSQHVNYLAVDSHIHELWWDSSGWHHNDLNVATGAPDAAGNPRGYMYYGATTQHVNYLGVDGHIHELWWLSACSRYLGLAMQHQLETEWCWSATSVSIALYYDPTSSWTQCALVNQAFSLTDCCSNGSSSACNQPWYGNKALSITGNLSSVGSSSASLATVVYEINGGRPISVNIQWYGGGGHNPAIDGYDNCDPSSPTVDIQDPWYGPSTQDFNSFPASYNGGATWFASYFTQ